jgi:hypothetical protein
MFCNSEVCCDLCQKRPNFAGFFGGVGRMIFVKTDWQRQRLVILTGECNNFLKNQVKAVLQTNDNNFRRHKLRLKDVSCSNFETHEFEEKSALEEIGVSLKEPLLIDNGFLRNLVREKSEEFRSLLRAGEPITEFILQRRLPSEKIIARNISAMNEFSLLRNLIRPMRIHPGLKRGDFYSVWNNIHDCYWKLLILEMRSIDPFLIRRETRRIHDDRGVPFDALFYETRNLPRQRKFMRNEFRLREVEEWRHRRL